MNSDVTIFLESLDHPLRVEIEVMRQCILDANAQLAENVKWNGPNYSFNGEDRITMKIQPPKNIQLIFHRGAKKLEQPTDRIIKDSSKLLIWKENDRAVATFNSLEDIERAKVDLKDLVQNWLDATK